MSLTQVRAFGAIMVLGVVMSIAMTAVHAEGSFNPVCPTGFVNFGDSLTDTGNTVDAFPFFSDAENLPYGEKFFGKPAKRFSNGRLIPDFFSLAFETPLLDAYFSVASFNYKYGVNFANAGATAAFSPTAITPFSVVPFQIGQFIRFQNSVVATEEQLGCFNFDPELPSVNPWSRWLYTIAAGGNDILPPIEQGVPVTVVNNTLVRQAVDAIVAAVVTLYQRGARQFLIFGLPAGGCSTVVLTLLGSGNLTTDSLGCNIAVNSVVQHFNSLLLSDIKSLRRKLTESNLAYFDYYSANIEILSNATDYGFNSTLTTTACCGAPGVGTLNYNPGVTCGHLGSNNCPNPDQYVNWDGVHFTEAFYRQIARFALNDQFTDGGINYGKLCDLDYSKWGSGVTFQQAYPVEGLCNNLFT